MLDMFDAACIPPQELLTRVLTVPWNDFSLAIQEGDAVQSSTRPWP